MQLAEIKKHPYFPFRDFRENDLSFLLLELYWVELFSSALSGARATDPGLSGWSAATPADRTDGNPILHMENRAVSPVRTLRIIQRENTNDLPELDILNMTPVRYFRDAFVPFAPGITHEAVDIDGVSPIEELVISADVSHASETYCLSLIRRWCLDIEPVATVEPLIDSYWKMVKSKLIEVDRPDLADSRNKAAP